MQRSKSLLIAFFVLISIPASAELSPRIFPSIWTKKDVSMELKGVALKRVFYMKAFVAGFYSEKNMPANVLDNIPKRIDVSYFVNIPVDKLCRYTERMMKLNMGDKGFNSVTAQVALMKKYFVNLKPGDQYAITYLPNEGTQFEYNGELIGTIPGEQFAKGLFSVWIGEKPMDPHLKKQILGL